MTQSLDERAVDRVLRRASDMARPEPLPSQKGVEPDNLVAAADEVGIPADAVRRSLAIEQLGPTQRSGQLDRIAGPKRVVDERVLPGSPDEVLGRIDRFLNAATHVQSGSVDGSSSEWLRQDDQLPNLRGSRRVQATVCPMDQATTAVKLTVDRRGKRRAAVVGGGLTGAATVFAVGSVAVPPLALAYLSVAGVGAVAVRRSRSKAAQLQREVASVLDTLDGGERRRVR